MKTKMHHIIVCETYLSSAEMLALEMLIQEEKSQDKNVSFHLKNL